MSDWLYGLIIVWVSVNMCFPVFYFALESTKMFYVTPWDLRETTHMNWFGCIFTSTLLFILLPLVWVGRFIYWLSHI